MEDVRDSYKAIKAIPAFVTALLREAERAGCWETGIVSDRKQRGTAINTAVYGYCPDRELAVVQVRQTIFHPRRFSEVKKNYYLLGRVESGAVFAHSIDSPLRSSLAMSDNPADCVDYVLAKIWGIKRAELCDVIRQGDVALVPVYAIPDGAVPIPASESVTLRDSHRVSGPAYKCGSELYVSRGAKLVHTKREHAPVKATAGYYRVVAGYRAPEHSFSLQTRD